MNQRKITAPRPLEKQGQGPDTQAAFSGKKVGTGGGASHPAPYSGTDGGTLRDDYRAQRSRADVFRDQTGEAKDAGDDVGSNYGGLKHTSKPPQR